MSLNEVYGCFLSVRNLIGFSFSDGVSDGLRAMIAEWITCLDKRSFERTGEDLDIIYARLKSVKAFEKIHPALLQHICLYGCYEELDEGVTCKFKLS